MATEPTTDSRTTAELFAATLEGEYDDDVPWEAVCALRLRATPEVFDVAKKFCQSDNPKARARGLDVMAQLGVGKPDSERPYLQECASIAIGHLEDKDALVVHSAAWALAHLQTNQAISTLIILKRHPDAGVRHAVAYGAGLRTEMPETIQTLIELMEDGDEHVRDWTTFELGSISSQDSPEIREALRKRLADQFEDARSEAIWGLARRKDQLGLQMLIERLESEDWVSGDEMAAQATLDLHGDTPVDELRVGLRKLLQG